MIDAMVPAFHRDLDWRSRDLRAGEPHCGGVRDQGGAISLRDGRWQRHADWRVGSGKLQRIMHAWPICLQGLCGNELDAVGAVRNVNIPLVLVGLAAKGHHPDGTRATSHGEEENDADSTSDDQGWDSYATHNMDLLGRDHPT
jgi:hypothetical protein